MSQTSLEGLFGSDEAPSCQKEDPISVMRILTAASCRSCRLGHESPNNPGFLWKGNLEAHIAIVGDMPSVDDVKSRRAFADNTGNELNDWIELAGIDPKDLFFTYLVQCDTPKTKSKIEKRNDQQRAPHVDAETGVCFQPRCQRVLMSLPNLEVIWALGVTTMATLLGGDIRIKIHQSYWFGSDPLPGKAVFGLPHPRDFDNTTAPSKRGKLRQHLQYFHNEYYGKKTKKGVELCPPKHALNILDYRAQERADAKQVAQLW